MAKPLMEDGLNQKIIACLQASGRMSHAELADRLEISRPTLIDRIKRLESEGIIEGYFAAVKPAAVNKPCVAYVSVKCRVERGKSETKFIEALAREPDILEAHTIAGDDSLLLKIVADTPMGINELLYKIRSLGQNSSTRTTMVLETHFVKPGPSPFPSNAPSHDSHSKKK
ncbi:MAG: Lrp/AsnC family transcriptional regulator [Holophagales bacterium]|jgi:Lrp/AsnC family leucine-responsive transcriptional regulator|nr:Lrp/AsnC family transcriptional regulator [Holophagales bacterium]